MKTWTYMVRDTRTDTELASQREAAQNAQLISELLEDVMKTPNEYMMRDEHGHLYGSTIDRSGCYPSLLDQFGKIAGHGPCGQKDIIMAPNQFKRYNHHYIVKTVKR